MTPLPLTQSFERHRSVKMWQTATTCNRKVGGSLSVCLMTLNLKPRPTTTYAALHSNDCYFGIMSICTVLNWEAAKSRLNTVLSYHAILANVSIAEWAQIWSRVMEMSDNWCSLTSWLVPFVWRDLMLVFYPVVKVHTHPHKKVLGSDTLPSDSQSTY